MPNEQLQNFIKESQKAGRSKEDIKKDLLASGWQDSDVEEAFKMPGTQTTVSAPVIKEPKIIKEQKVASPESSKKLLWIVLAVVVVIVLAAGAYMLFLKPQTSVKPQQAQTQATSTASTTTVVVPPTPVAASCTASGPASAIYTQGSVTSVDSFGKTQKLTDDCADATYMEKYICYESPVGSGKFASGRQVVKCANGCVSGACKK